MDFPISDATARLLAGRYTDGNPLTATPASRHDSNTHNRIIDSILAVQASAGLTPVEANVNQLRDAILQLLNQGPIKTSVRAATTANITVLAGVAPNALDGVTLVANDRLLIKDQTTASQNGIYVVTTLGTGANGTWTRATDADGVGELYGGMLVAVQEGTVFADRIFELQTNGTIIIGTTSQTWINLLTGSYMLLQDQKAQGVDGGASAVGLQTRVLNTVVFNNIAGASLNTSTGTITLPAGTYKIRADVPGFINVHKSYLNNITDALPNFAQGTNANGLTAGTVDPVQTSSIITTYFSIMTNKDFNIRTYCSEVLATFGLGRANSQGIEIYTSIEISKEF